MRLEWPTVGGGGRRRSRSRSRRRKRRRREEEEEECGQRHGLVNCSQTLVVNKLNKKNKYLSDPDLS